MLSEHKKLVTAKAVTPGGTAIVTDPIWCRNILDYSVHFTFTGQVYGTASIEVSNDGDSQVGGNPAAISTWTPDTTSIKTVSASIASGDTSNVGYFYQSPGFGHFVRAKFVQSSDPNNNGAISINAVIKGFGK